MSLYGNGVMKLDGSELEADFIPRLGTEEVSELPVVGAPTQVLLDVAQGAAIEIQVRGSVGDVEVKTVPIPVVTNPVREFFDWVSGKE